MSQAAATNSSGTPRALRVCLVAGPDSLARLGPVVRHLIVGILDQPMHVAIACPHGADAGYVPSPPVWLAPYERPRLALGRKPDVKALARQLEGADVRLLHGLDTDALDLTRRLAEEMDLDYLISVFSLGAPVRPADPRCRAVLAGSEPIRRMLLSTRAAESSVELLRPAVHRAGKATCFIDPRHTPAIVAAGRLSQYRPFAAVLEAFAKLHASGRQCVFFVIGEGHSEPALRRLAEKLGLMGRLTFVDRQQAEQLMGILRAADIFISPTPSERIEIELLSAMAAGVPVLTADSKACDFIVPDRTALTFEPANADQLAEKLEGLLDDRASARALADSALALLAENHSPARMAQQLAQLYRSIAAAPRPTTE